MKPVPVILRTESEEIALIWEMSYKADPRAREIAARHYNRQKPGTPQFVPPGRALVRYTETETGRAFWVTSYPFAQYVRHAWAGAWICSAVRNEGAGVASEMIRDAVAATRAYFGAPPDLPREPHCPRAVQGETPPHEPGTNQGLPERNPFLRP